MSAIRVRVLDQTPRVFLVDRIDETGAVGPEPLTLTDDELGDCVRALDQADLAPPGSEVVVQYAVVHVSQARST